MISHDDLIKMLDYNMDTGDFLWKVPVSKNKSGSFAGTLNNHGYWQIQIKKRSYMAHRLAWFYVYGSWPGLYIDHINGNKTDNRINNLRAATPSNNQHNRGKSKRNITGLKGVSYDVKRRKWVSGISYNGIKMNLGRYDCPAAASFAYQIAADIYHGDYARL